MKVEICCHDITSVKAAVAGGADRIELCCALSEGGLTPTASLTLAARRLCGNITRMHILLRPRSGDFLYSDEEFDLMLDDLSTPGIVDADGYVFGALTPEGDINMEQCRCIRTATAGKPLTFHRAFDMTADPLDALEKVIGLGYDRILTSGCAASAEAGIPMLRQLQQRAAARIIIMAAGGISPANVAHIVKSTGVSEVHASASVVLPSAMRFRNTAATMGSPEADEYMRKVTSAEVVRNIIAALP